MLAECDYEEAPALHALLTQPLEVSCRSHEKQRRDADQEARFRPCPNTPNEKDIVPQMVPTSNTLFCFLR
jgi:hypothetical protein